MSEYLDAIVFIDRCEAKVFNFRAADAAILAMGRHFFGTRNHRHATAPDLSFRHNDTPSKF